MQGTTDAHYQVRHDIHRGQLPPDVIMHCVNALHPTSESTSMVCQAQREDPAPYEIRSTEIVTVTKGCRFALWTNVDIHCNASRIRVPALAGTGQRECRHDTHQQLLRLQSLIFIVSMAMAAGESNARVLHETAKDMPQRVHML